MLNKFRTWLADVIRPAAPVAPIVDPAPTSVPAPTVEVAQTVPVAPDAPAPTSVVELEQLMLKELKSSKVRPVVRANDLIDAHEFSAISGLAARTILNYGDMSVRRSKEAKEAFPKSVTRVRNGNTYRIWRRFDAVYWSHFYWSNELGNGRVKKSMYVDLNFVADMTGVSYQTAWQLYRQTDRRAREGQRIRLHRAEALRLVLDYLESKAAR